jgi:predicted DNA-binding transcriptional regulator YafY
VAGHGDAALARAARDLIAKIAVTIPDTLKPLILDAGARTPPGWKIPPDGFDVAQARAWIKSGRKMALLYRDSQDRETERVIWPAVIGYFDAARTLIGWCERRRAFRSFRIDRVKHATFLDERYPERPSTLRTKWMASMRNKLPVQE